MDKPKTPRHMVSVTPPVLEQLEEFKQELEKQLQFRLTYSQAIAWLIAKRKETK